MTSTYDRLADLPLTVEGYELEPRHQEVSGGFSRVTMVVRLAGAGLAGVGEDVSYDPDDQNRHFQRGMHLPLAGSHTVASFSALLNEVDLYPDPLQMDWQRPYRRWAYESAALDLALRQRGVSLADALERTAAPMRFVVSMGLGDPPAMDKLTGWLARDPSLRFKLDATPSWSEEFCRSVAATGAVDVVDLKGQYQEADFAPEADPELYARVAAAFSDAWIEDPDLSKPCRDALGDYEERVTWDAPIHSVDDILALPYEPLCINVKPSRFGTLERLFDAYDFLAERGIEVYGGGQFELGAGRGQIQCLAAIFHPDGPNDVAPPGYNAEPPPARVPSSPLSATCSDVGFRGAESEPGR